MKMKAIFSLACLTALLASTGYAKELNLYESPIVGAKSTGKVDLANGIIPIFTQKDGKWVKIADPSNGNVGWVPAAELNANPHTSFSFTIGTPKSLTPEQIKAFQKMQQQQQAVQQSIQKNMQDLIQNMNNLYQQQGFPIMTPVIIVPAK